MDPADKSVLVVDDEPAVQALLTDAVEASGWTAFTASNAAEALSSLEDRVPQTRSLPTSECRAAWTASNFFKPFADFMQTCRS